MKKCKDALKPVVFVLTMFSIAVFLASIGTIQGGSAAPLQGSFANIWVGKGCGANYNDGEQLDVYFYIHSSAPHAVITITHRSAQGSSQVWISQNRINTKETYRLFRTTSCPEGRNVVTIEAVIVEGGVESIYTGQCEFYVINCQTRDFDRDGHDSAEAGGDDCDDSDPAVYPGAGEVCDGKDNDCNGQTDEGLDCNYVEIWVDKSCGGQYNDRESVEVFFDVHSSAASAVVTITEYTEQGASTVIMDSRSVATNRAHSSTTTARCSAGLTTLAISATVTINGISKTFVDECSYYVDFCQTTDYDGDGHDSVMAGGDDCDDDDSTVYPGAEEVCDGKDNNCNGQSDEGYDNDGDGYGGCAGDCNDDDSTVYPGAEEVCDGKDNNCNGQTDEGFTDNDQDGFTDCGGDCDDTDPQVYPGASEIDDTKDNDCDGQIDEKLSMDQIDDDQDGHPLSTDCNDRDPAIYPGAPEMCGDAKDNDCDGTVDCGDTDCEGDSACSGGFSLPFNVSGIFGMLGEYKLYIAGGLCGVVAVILVVFLFNRMKKAKRGEMEGEEPPPAITTDDVTFPKGPEKSTPPEEESISEPEEDFAFPSETEPGESPQKESDEDFMEDFLQT